VFFGNIDAARGWAGGLILALALAGAFGCGGADDPAQVTAPAVTGASELTDAEQAPGTDALRDEPAADPQTDRAAISITLNAVLTGTDPDEVCGELVTERYLREAYGGARGCEAAQADTKTATDVRLSRVDVLPDSVAQASAEPQGGIYDGEQLRAELVLDDGVWKLDSLRSNVPVGP
jgi:hypothetical protein